MNNFKCTLGCNALIVLIVSFCKMMIRKDLFHIIILLNLRIIRRFVAKKSENISAHEIWKSFKRNYENSPESTPLIDDFTQPEN